MIIFANEVIMNKQDGILATQSTVSPGFVLDGSVSVILKPAPRLLVLISEDDLDNFYLSRQIWEIARPQKTEVVLLALCRDPDQEPHLRRGLTTMAAIIRDDAVCVDFQIGHEKNWLSLIKQEWRPGDLLVCGSEHYIGLSGRPLSKILSSHFNTNVRVFSVSGVSRKPMSKIAGNIIFWFGSVCILSVFFWVEVMIPQTRDVWERTFLIFLCILFEVKLLWMWNFLF
jgi:hypothetical protein